MSDLVHIGLGSNLGDREQNLLLATQALSIFGDPARCLEKVKTYHRAGVTHLLVMFDWGGMPQQTIFHSMELFARYVMSSFQEPRPSESAPIEVGETVAARPLDG